MIIASVALLAVVGGTLAFKAEKFQSFTFYRNDNAVIPSCTVAFVVKSTIDPLQQTFHATYSTTSSTAACTGIYLKPTGE